MGDLKFILGFIAGWIATTDEGKKAASSFATQISDLAKKGIEAATKKEE